MTRDTEILRAARAMIDVHGGDAATVAENRARQLFFAKQQEGAALWQEIARAVRDIQALPTRRPGDRGR